MPGPSPIAITVLDQHRDRLRTFLTRAVRESEETTGAGSLMALVDSLTSPVLTFDMARPVLDRAMVVVNGYVPGVNQYEDAAFREVLGMLLLTSAVHPDWFTDNEHDTLASRGILLAAT